jgi:hypothetical protein
VSGLLPFKGIPVCDFGDGDVWGLVGEGAVPPLAFAPTLSLDATGDDAALA